LIEDKRWYAGQCGDVGVADLSLATFFSEGIWILPADAEARSEKSCHRSVADEALKHPFLIAFNGF
jgi:hypothetical protein